MLTPDKVRVFNLPKYMVPAFTNDAGVTANASAATQMRIPGVGITKISQVKKVSLIRGTSPVQNTWRITMANAAAGLPQNTKVFFEVDIETTNREFRLARPEYEFGQTLRYEISVSGSEAASDIATKLADTINSQSERERDFLITAAVANSSAVVLTVAQPEGYSKFYRGTYIESVSVKNEEGDTSTDVVPSANAVATPAFRGIGYGSDVEFKEKLQSGNLTGYFFDNQEVPEEDTLYTQIAWEFDVSRPHPKDPTLGDTTRNVIYVKETDSTLESRINDIADFFLTSASTRGTNYESIIVGANDAAPLAALNAASTEIVAGYYEYAFTGAITSVQSASAAVTFKTNA